MAAALSQGGGFPGLGNRLCGSGRRRGHGRFRAESERPIGAGGALLLQLNQPVGDGLRMAPRRRQATS